MTPAEAIELNQRWADSYETDKGREKVAAFHRRWIGDHLAEDSFINRQWTPTPVTPNELDRTVNSKDPVMIEEIRRGNYAMCIDFSGSSEGEIVRTEKYAVAFFKIQTATIYYYVEQLWTSKRPVVEHLKEDMAEALGDGLDRAALVQFETAVWFLEDEAYSAVKFNTEQIALGNTREISVFKSEGAKAVTANNGNPLATWDVNALQKKDFTRMVQAYNGREGEQLAIESMLVSTYDLAPVSDFTIETVGDNNVSKSMESVAGYKTLKGIRPNRTGKQRWLKPGNIYLFGPMEDMGSYYQIGGVETWSERKANRVDMFSWIIVGLGIGNIAQLRKYELYSASAHPGQTDGTVAGYTVSSVQPKPEKHVIKNHRADEGHWFPSFTQG